MQLVTSAVRPIPLAWKNLPNLHLVVSVDGLQPEHDRRRSPATYDRVLKHIAGHQVIIHCTITRQLLRPNYLRDFASFWSLRDEVRKIWFSLFTPQQGHQTQERLTPEDRQEVIGELAHLRASFAKMYVPDVLLNGYLHPPSSPQECIFAQTTTCISADLATCIKPVPIPRSASLYRMRPHSFGWPCLDRKIQVSWSGSGFRYFCLFEKDRRAVQWGAEVAAGEGEAALVI